jgi:ferrochelatase
MPPPIGVVLLQLGTPDAAETRAVRRYLAEFLADRRVVDLNRALWLPLLHGVILRTRPAKSARLYKKVWTAQGSPLAVTSQAQASGLQQRLNADAGRDAVAVRVAMRYGNPSLSSVLDELRAQGVERLLAFPMYPQYAGATTGSSLEQLFRAIAGHRIVPSVRVVPPYFDDPEYIEALARSVERSVAQMDVLPDKLLFSFHGLPKRYADEGDPYPQHCRATAAALTARLGLPEARVAVTFQSRFGREEWLQPYTDATLDALGRDGARLLVACPGFTADCLETLEEIQMTGGERFISRGGVAFAQVPCLNDDPFWLDTMAHLARRELANWL